MPLRLKSLSTELTIVFASLAVGLVVVLSYFAFQMASRSLEESVRRDLFNTVDQATASLDKELQERIREVETVSLSPLIRDAAIVLSESHTTIPLSERREQPLRDLFGGRTCLAERPEIVRHLETVIATHHYITEFLLTDKFGIAIGCTGDPGRIRHSHQAWWQEAVHRGVSLSNLELDTDTGTYQYAVSIAIPDGKRSPAGVLRAILNLNEVQESLNLIRIGEHGFVMAMGRTGRVFAHPDRQYLWKKVEDFPELSHLADVVRSKRSKGVLIYVPSVTEPTATLASAAMAAGSASGARQSRSGGSGPPTSLAWAPEDSWILAYARMFRHASLGPLGWTVVGTVSRAEVIAPIAAIRYRVAAIGGAVILVSISLVWFLSRRLARPLNDLSQRADVIAAGDLSVNLAMPERNEIGRLALALSSMVGSLGDANRSLTRTNLNLEGIVTERTTELEEKSRLLEEQSNQVLEASRLKSQFLANMSHELRTPLNAILALSDILAQRISGDLNEEQVKQVTIINRSGGNLLRLINDILDLSKIEAGRMEVHLDVFDLKGTLGAIRDTIEPLAADKGLGFDIILDPALPHSIRSDDPKIRQVLVNLLGNAVKFTDEGRVSLTLSRRYKILPGSDEMPPAITDEGPFWLGIKVEDSGVGIAPKALENIFDEFQQGDGSATRKYGGSGLGLAISKKIVELLGGEISAESELGKGSTFKVLLPVEGVATEAHHESSGSAAGPRAQAPAPGPDAALGSSPTSPRPPTSGAPGRTRSSAPRASEGTSPRPWVTPLREHPVPISPRFLDIRDDTHNLLPHIPTLLVVDDDPESLYVYRQFLSRQGYQVIFAINGEQVLDKARQFRPVAIILDLMLPHKSGWEVLEELKIAEDLKEIPVIIASALDHRDRGLCSGAFRYLTKPMSEKQLSSVLKELEKARKKDVRRVLVIDDDPVELGIARTLFEKAGLDVITRENGEEAIEWARSEQPDIIVLDLLMPVMDGFEVLARLKATPDTADIPVLIYTAKDVTEEDRRRLLPSARRIFPKVPLQIEEMLEELDVALRALPIRRSRENGPGASPPAPRVGTSIHATEATSTQRERKEGSPPSDGAGDREGTEPSDSREARLPGKDGPVPESVDRPNVDSRTRILLVEDDAANQYSVGFLLTSEGYEVMAAENGEEGVHAAERHRPDLILMDMMMPVMSGFDATRILKSRAELKDIPVIALTAAAMAGDRERTLAAGCDDYVSKPVDRRLLLERVRHWERFIGRNREPRSESCLVTSDSSGAGEPVGAAAPAGRRVSPTSPEENSE